MKRSTFLLIVIVIVLFAGWLMLYAPGTTLAPTENVPTLIDTVTYLCDGDKTITASYYKGPEAPEPQQGEPPTPTGSVEVSLDGSTALTLQQTISASGIRYANEDESFVFWSKGKDALVMRDNAMDPTYTNCTAQDEN